jgi:hypothetical protein
MLRVLLLFAILLTGALAVHEKVVAGLDPNGNPTATQTSDQMPGLDPNGLQTTAPTTDIWGGLDPNG